MGQVGELAYFISGPRGALLNKSYFGLNNRINYGLKSYWSMEKINYPL